MHYKAAKDVKYYARRYPTVNYSVTTHNDVRIAMEKLINLSSNVAYLQFIEFDVVEKDKSITRVKGVQLEYFCSEMFRCLH